METHQIEPSAPKISDSSARNAASVKYLAHSFEFQSPTSRTSETDFGKAFVWPSFRSLAGEADRVIAYSCEKIIDIDEVYVNDHCSYCGADFTGGDVRRRGMHLAYEHSFGSCSERRLQ
jgi:hypothetical protein